MKDGKLVSQTMNAHKPTNVASASGTSATCLHAPSLSGLGSVGVPDVFAKDTPEDGLKGFDRELKAAVNEAPRMPQEGRWQSKQ